MNWLAHFVLAEPTPAFRVGSVLPDFVPASVIADLPGDFRRGAEHHRQVDLFTDAHPIVRHSRQRFLPPFRRFGGVITDVLYDHFLACDWASYSSIPLPQFAAEIYACFDTCRAGIPAQVHDRLQLMRDHDWLCSYREMSGISEALRRIGQRLRRPFQLEASMSFLEEHYDAFRDDFRTFFPELQAHTAPKILKP